MAIILIAADVGCASMLREYSATDEQDHHRRTDETIARNRGNR
jgi:hypothetical protein